MGKRLLSVSVLIVSCCVLANNRVWLASWFSRAEAQQEKQELDPKLQYLADRYEAYVRGAMRAEEVPGAAVAIVKDSTIVMMKGFGVKSTITSDSVDEHTVFRLASLSKGFAPILTAQFIREGCLNWDDKVISFIPYFALRSKEQAADITLRHVLSHTTGLPRHSYSNLLNMGWYYEQIFPKLKEVKIVDKPGERYNYQNVIYSVIGDVLHSATGKSYTRLLNERIFTPAGMNDASASYHGIISAEDVARPHWFYKGQGYKPIEISRNYYEVIPAAGVNASIADMAQWLQVLMGNRPEIITPEELEDVFKPEIWVNTRELRQWDGMYRAWYAKGWRVLDFPKKRIIYHGGFVNGFRTEIAFDPKEKVGIVVLSNAMSNFIGQSVQVFFDIYETTKHKDVADYRTDKYASTTANGK
ncbi:MAG: serine hydrolase domain-containing protein [Saprospiraceae bacterium]